MKAGFTGTQRGMTDAQKSTLRCLMAGVDSFHHGDCIGADEEAHDIAEQFGAEVTIHPPQNAAKRAFRPAKQCLKPLPYLVRNRNIVDATEALFATPGEDTEQLRSGTWSTVRYARKVGKPVWLILPDGFIVPPNQP